MSQNSFVFLLFILALLTSPWGSYLFLVWCWFIKHPFSYGFMFINHPISLLKFICIYVGWPPIWCSTFALDPRELERVQAEAAGFQIPVHSYNIKHQMNTQRALPALLVTILLRVYLFSVDWVVVFFSVDRVYFVYFLWIGFILFIFCGLDPTRFCNLLEWVKEQIQGGRLVLCHCIRGRNRSPALAAGLLAWSKGQSVRSCVSWV